MMVMKLEQSSGLIASKFYAGIGSRNTPDSIEPYIEEITKYLNIAGYTLRSGGAPGADSTFEKYATIKEIYLPWKNFNENKSGLFLNSMDQNLVQKAKDIAKMYHPFWIHLSEAGKKLMTRNTFQILGIDLKTPVDFVVCWTQEGRMKGGTGQALRISKSLDIPIFNLYNNEIFYKIKNHILSI